MTYRIFAHYVRLHYNTREFNSKYTSKSKLNRGLQQQKAISQCLIWIYRQLAQLFKYPLSNLYIL